MVMCICISIYVYCAVVTNHQYESIHSAHSPQIPTHLSIPPQCSGGIPSLDMALT